MNYYPFHLGDYASHTGHLEPMEDLAYRRLLDVYYMREGPLPSDIQVTAKLVRMRSMLGDVESVLNEFFELTAGGWVHVRCELEIAEMQERQSVAKAKANKRWDKHRAEHSIASAMPQHQNTDAAASKSNADAMLPTPTPTPTPTPINNTSACAPPDGVPDSVWLDFKSLRRAKKAPITKSAIDGIRREAEKAGLPLEDALRECCARGWTGFKADWMAEKTRAPPASYKAADDEKARARWEEMTGRKHPANQIKNVIDITPKRMELSA